MSKKRADTQVDWAISLGLFLLYLAWFFIFVRPLYSQELRPANVDLLKEKFIENTSWTVNRYPIIINSNFSFPDEPIVADFNFDFNKTNAFIMEKSFFMGDGKIFFVNSITNSSNKFYLLNSEERYEPFNEASDLTATENLAITSNMSVDFENATIIDVNFDGIKINSFRVLMNGIELNTNNTNFSQKRTIARYKVIGQTLNHSSYIFARNSRIYGLVRAIQNHNMKIEVNLDNYESYFSNNVNRGNVPYPDSCNNFEGRMIDFYTNQSNLLFVFERNANISFCAKNTSIYVVFEFESGNETLYKIIFFKGDFTDSLKYLEGHESYFGANEKISGFSETRLLVINATSYNRLKNEFGVGDFRIIVNELNLSYGANPVKSENIYANEFNGFLLDKFANVEKITISLMAWT